MRYKAYKKVDLPWLEEIPEHWEIAALKRFTDIYTGNSIPDEKKDHYTKNDSARPYISTKDIRKDNNTIDYNNGMYIQKNDLSFKIAPKGASLVCIEGGSGGEKIGYLEKEVSFVNKLCCVSSEKQVNDKFVFFLLLSNQFKHQYKMSVTGDRNGVNLGKLGTFNFALPPKEEQEQIAEFLDWKINEIDRLIGLERAKINSVENLKQVLINKYLFSGLDKNVPKVNITTDYTNSIPESWKFESIKRNFEIVKNIVGEEGYNILSITQKGIKIKDISANEGQMAQNYSNYQFVEVGDFAMNHMDLLTGYIDISKHFGVTSPDYRVFRIKNDKKIYPEYYLLMFQLFYKRRVFYKLGQGAARMGRWRLPAKKFLKMYVPVPSFDEQKRIVDKIKSELLSLNKYIENLDNTIQALKNLKKTLISDVVTGKVDIRNIDIPEYEKVQILDDTLEEDTEVEIDFEEED
ncbi:MAG TPA: restriction endonuclease subunit S [Clostridia bacterium]|jgi:type I restriction enzyme S subunit|nr:restriction endonuclease subunit S [Clostridiaceae bacterium]HOM34711.1 restriction endonuclease subunit S [Clostridia bacterium]HOR90322.1 restriction endonuclease subunit S [Clostridia bacterium]HOT70248.1 restriction endonuclease subunit S [Clostridia bacterium]HQG00488.1 restriction endonuclease subunit S [Clostridia bacterium]